MVVTQPTKLKTTMKRLVIIGAGGFGREVFNWACDVVQQEWCIGGFLDQNAMALAGFSGFPPIIGDPATYVPCEQDVFVCAIGDPKTKLRLSNSIQERGGCFISLIHPTSVVGTTCNWGQGCIFCPGSVVTANVSLGSFVTINLCATVGHDACIGDGCTLSGHADVTGAATLGRGVFLGSHAVVLPKAKVGDYATVGAGSVVLRSVKAHSTVFGVPAKMISTSKE